ncbi:hypothetical protein AAMO2058_001182400 [Amorphochlora amoebiformis]
MNVDVGTLKGAVRELKEASSSLKSNKIDFQKLKNTVSKAKGALENTLRMTAQAGKTRRPKSETKRWREPEQRKAGKEARKPLPAKPTDGLRIGDEYLWRGEKRVKLVSKKPHPEGKGIIVTVKRLTGKRPGTTVTTNPASLRPLPPSERTEESQGENNNPLKALGEKYIKTRDGRIVDPNSEKPRKVVYLNGRVVKPPDRDRCDRTLRRFFSGKNHYLIGEKALGAIRRTLGGNRGRVLDLMRCFGRKGRSLESFEKSFTRHIANQLPRTSPARKRIDEIKSYVKREFLWWRDKSYVYFKEGSEDEQENESADKNNKKKVTKGDKPIAKPKPNKAKAKLKTSKVPKKVSSDSDNELGADHKTMAQKQVPKTQRKAKKRRRQSTAPQKIRRRKVEG